MKLGSALIAGWLIAAGQAQDMFNFDYTNEVIDGVQEWRMEDWDQVDCFNDATCLGYPDKYPHAFGWELGENNCKWCPRNSPNRNCGVHRQSPIDLFRDPAVVGGEQEKECTDWHNMQHKDDTCNWQDMANSFDIMRHALRINIPTLPNGDIDCVEDGQRIFPRIDYSKGFPDWWFMQAMDVSVPSQHRQHGKRYAAEVTLEYFYEKTHVKNQIGHVSIFMQDYEDAESWPYLDKLICAWRLKEEETRAACGEPPATPYGRCRLFRDQEPTDEWLEEAGLLTTSTDEPTAAPTEIPTATPTSFPTSEPTTDGLLEQENLQPTFGGLFPGFSFGFFNNLGLTFGTGGGNGGLFFGGGDLDKESTETSPTPAPTDAFVELGNPDEPQIPPSIDCTQFDVNYQRMCHSSDPCCEDTRGDSPMCWDIYDNVFPGESIKSACYHCCPEGPKLVGDPTPPNPAYPLEVACSSTNAQRLCKSNSCCSNPRSTSGWCEDQYDLWGDQINAICWSCCSEPQDVGPARRRLGGASSNSTTRMSAPVSVVHDDEHIPEGAKVTYSKGKRYLLRAENFEAPKESWHDEFARVYADFKERELMDATIIHDEDYEDVHYRPHEWLIKVGTEYYYRYEGTQVVPPCREFVHWRVMKDPIRVAPRQIAELNRLLANRIAPVGAVNECNFDTAGIVHAADKVKLNRDIQYFHKGHRMVFCECQDWPSVFDGDQVWCNKWPDDVNYTRLEQPYNFPTDGW